ncbi:unnamed protein product [Toxocara canis]|uniref:Uncharacterized protein n=1 Tax=Toxocara canis TaxID=6265 RepID=A0A183TVV5_TOXCA|nr:unnamed protein product [Toxocara canis]
MSSLKGRPTSAKCNCCPYGFHIDLDFVKFAENIANGNSPQQQSKSIRRSSKEPAASCNSPSAASPRPRNIMSPMESLYSDSLENIVSDFEETFNPPRDYCSDRENAFRFEQVTHTNGYLSDFGPRKNRSLPSRITHWHLACDSSVGAKQFVLASFSIVHALALKKALSDRPTSNPEKGPLRSI